jgi:hypothetical protein
MTFQMKVWLMAAWVAASTSQVTSQVKYINTSFENASQLDWQIDSAGAVNIELIYDHERSSVNRANGHWHFQVQAEAGSGVIVILKKFENYWNGRMAYPVSEKTNCLVSTDGIKWKPVTGEFTAEKNMKFRIHMDSDKVYLASVEPYRISDLDKMIARIKKNPLVQVSAVGHTVEGRPLEIIRVGNPNAPHSIFLRARAHSWEPGGNWVVEGLIKNLLAKDGARYLKKYCVYIMPMANKDGVARGRTRFNSQGVDLNRQWDKPADSVLAPEKYAFENWLTQMIAKGRKPDLAIDLHNDQEGFVHVNMPRDDNKEYTAHLNRFVDLLYKHTWFREGPANVNNPGSLGEGLARRFGIDACIYELNYEWAKGLNKVPMGADWMLLGKQLRDVFFNYFE